MNKKLNSKKNQYWVFVLDNYERDLPSIVWWIYEKYFNNNKIFCILPKELAVAKFFLEEKPDIIIWNYARANNINAIKVANQLNIYNIVHDTEGIPYELDKYFNNINRKDFKYIDEVWCWGETQAEIIRVRCKGLTYKPKIKTTGSIRYEYMKSLGRCESKITNSILWCTNYALINPRYQSQLKEFEEHYLKYKLMSKKETLKKFIKYAKQQEYSEFCINILASKFDKTNIIIRPHPFEKINYYHKLINKKSLNIKLSEQNHIQDELNYCDIIIQSGCQTVLDGFIRGVPSIRLIQEEMNIWSKVTPFININKLENDFTSEENLRKIFEDQKALFKKYNVNKLLFNLDQKLNYSSINSKKINQSNLINNMIINIFKVKLQVKIILKTITKKNNLKNNNIKSIYKYISSRYIPNRIKSEKYCKIYPKNLNQ